MDEYAVHDLHIPSEEEIMNMITDLKGCLQQDSHASADGAASASGAPQDNSSSGSARGMGAGNGTAAVSSVQSRMVNAAMYGNYEPRSPSLRGAQASAPKEPSRLSQLSTRMNAYVPDDELPSKPGDDLEDWNALMRDLQPLVADQPTYDDDGSSAQFSGSPGAHYQAGVRQHHTPVRNTPTPITRVSAENNRGQTPGNNALHTSSHVIRGPPSPLLQEPIRSVSMSSIRGMNNSSLRENGSNSDLWFRTAGQAGSPPQEAGAMQENLPGPSRAGQSNLGFSAPLCEEDLRQFQQLQEQQQQAQLQQTGGANVPSTSPFMLRRMLVEQHARTSGVPYRSPRGEPGGKNPLVQRIHSQSHSRKSSRDVSPDRWMRRDLSEQESSASEASSGASSHASDLSLGIKKSRGRRRNRVTPASKITPTGLANSRLMISSRTCHACGHVAKGRYAACSNLALNKCRKIFCERCVLKIMTPEQVEGILVDPAFVCFHCQGTCMPGSQCFYYTSARKQQQQKMADQPQDQSEARLDSQMPQMSLIGDSRMNPTMDLGTEHDDMIDAMEQQFLEMDPTLYSHQYDQ
ncbi:hypothetical protein FVE85_2848 [Porphyridium purpureum]|uniref:Zinc-finger domain-containing protein n=1 Tax=Porphyridium purpureum TaxID=35688 RepID=A0A5J4YW18_PORPP|nr:hypothetical protein FVE85_2848 [Porphyridium purpureum]|eukprot:POR3021..scf227_4